jgi:hypothetical protein
MPAIGATNNPLRRTCAPILIDRGRLPENREANFIRIAARKESGRGALVVFSRQGGRAENHAPREESARARDDIERRQRHAARCAREAIRADEGAGECVGYVDGGPRIEPASRRVARERGFVAGIGRFDKSS